VQPNAHRPLQHPCLEAHWQLTKSPFGVDKVPFHWQSVHSIGKEPCPNPLQKHLFDFGTTKKGICGAPPMLYQMKFLKTRKYLIKTFKTKENQEARKANPRNGVLEKQRIEHPRNPTLHVCRKPTESPKTRVFFLCFSKTPFLSSLSVSGAKFLLPFLLSFLHS
jgi:hypothetical protein